MVRAIEREEIRVRSHSYSLVSYSPKTNEILECSQQALLDPKKISRERVGAELDKMLLGRDPQYAFELIERLHLHPLIFLYEHDTTFSSSLTSPPTSRASSPPPLPDSSLSVTASNLLTSVLSPNPSSNLPALHPLLRLISVSPPPLPPHSTLPPYPEPTPLASTPPPSPSSPPLASIYPHTLKRLYLSCGLLPLYDLSTVDKKKTMWIGEKVVRDGIKGPTIDSTWCRKLREGWLVLSERVRGFEAKSDKQDRVEIGELSFLLCSA